MKVKFPKYFGFLPLNHDIYHYANLTWAQASGNWYGDKYSDQSS